MLNTAPHLRGFQKGDRNPTSVVAGEGSQGEGKSGMPLPAADEGMPLFPQPQALRGLANADPQSLMRQGGKRDKEGKAPF